jgi:hypothetical protein
MPGRDERQPADADRAPASRVGDELQERVDQMTADGHEPSSHEMVEAEQEAEEAAEERQWDQEATREEGRRAG